MATPDMDSIKEVPGYRVILKAVLKSQIQQLIKQLASATNEESIIMTASVADGTLSYLGSDSAKGFLEDHEDVKSQFLCYCLRKMNQKQEDERQEKEQKDQEEALLKLPLTAAGQYGEAVHSYSSQFVSARKSGLVHPVSLTRSSPGIRHEPYSRPSTRQVTPTKITEVASVKIEPSGSEIETFTNNSHQSSYSLNSAVTNDDQNVNCSLSVKAENFSDESRGECGDGDKSEVSDDASVNVKQEATSDSETDLEITGVEVGQPMQPQDWGVNVSMGMNLDPTGATGSQADMMEESSNNLIRSRSVTIDTLQPSGNNASPAASTKRKFKREWKAKFPFVRFDCTKQLMFCQICESAGRINTWTSGCSKLKIDGIKKHSLTRDHKFAVAAQKASVRIEQAAINVEEKERYGNCPRCTREET